MARLPPSGRESPSGSLPRSSPLPLASAVSDMLRDLELDVAEDDDYSLLDGSSFASAPPPRPPPVLTRSHTRAQGTSSPVLMTPVRAGGGSRGGYVVGVSPSSGATSRAQMNSPIVVPAAKGTGKPQHCVFIDDAAMANLCFGLIGTGERFCMATKIEGKTHCGVSAHAKGIRKKNKAKVVVDAFYVPGGPSWQGRQPKSTL